MRELCQRQPGVWESHRKNSIVSSAERLCEGEPCCLRHRRKVSTLGLLNEIYHRVQHPMNECLNHLVAARYTRVSAALGELALVVLRCRINRFSRLFQPAAVRL